METGSPVETTAIDPLIEMLDESRTLLETASGSFQIFAKLVSGKTVTLNDITPKTTIAALHEQIKSKDGGIPVSEKYLVYGGKNLYDGTVGTYGIGREATVHVMMRLRGGYGERQAVKYTLDKGIQRGNNAQTVEDTGGKSRAHKDWGRHIASQDSVYQEIFRRLRKLPDVDLTQEWWEKNQIHVRSLIQEITGAGNCGDFAQIVHSQLVANTDDQHVYEVVMAGAWDHQLCLTYPSKVSSIAAMDKEIATIADGWDNYMVIPLKKFLGGTNCYGATITNLDKCPDCGKSSGDGCKTEEDKEKKCKGFLTIVAQQECDGGGGLPASAKDAIGGLITDLFEDWKASDDYTEYLDKVKDDRRGIFRFRVAEDVTDRRSEGDILTKLEKLRKEKAPTLKAELLDLEDDNLLAVFGDGETWRDLTLSIAEVRQKLYAAMTAQGTAGFLQCINHLSEPQFLAYLDADPAHAAKVLATPYAALRYHGYLSRASDAEVAKRMEALSDGERVKLYDASKDAKKKILGSVASRNLLFASLAKLGGGELTRLVGTLGGKLTDFFGSSPAARAAILGDAGLKGIFFTHLSKQKGTPFGAMASLLTPEQLREFFKSDKAAAKAVLKSTLKEDLYKIAQGVDDTELIALMAMVPDKVLRAFADSDPARRERIEGIAALKKRYGR
jgi:hypothetical protein